MLDPCAGGPRRLRIASTAIASLSVEAAGKRARAFHAAPAAGAEILDERRSRTREGTEEREQALTERPVLARAGLARRGVEREPEHRPDGARAATRPLRSTASRASVESRGGSVIWRLTRLPAAAFDFSRFPFTTTITRAVPGGTWAVRRPNDAW